MDQSNGDDKKTEIKFLEKELHIPLTKAQQFGTFNTGRMALEIQRQKKMALPLLIVKV